MHEVIQFLQTHLPALIEGLRVTLQLTVGGAALALMLSVAAGPGRLSRHRAFRWPANLYVEVFRGTSALIQLFWFYFCGGTVRRRPPRGHGSCART